MAKLLWMRDRSDNEVGGFGVSAADDLLLIEDFVVVKQTVSLVSVAFDDEAVADYLDAQVDRGIGPERCLRTWIHTHPGESPQPSGVDEQTFERVFGPASWAVMAIVAQTGQTYARIRFSAGPGGQTRIPIEVDWRAPLRASDHEAWEAQYVANVSSEPRWNGGRRNGHELLSAEEIDELSYALLDDQEALP